MTKINAQTYKSILENSYKSKKKRATNIDGYDYDHELSNDTSQVYHHKEHGKAVVAHTGSKSMKDWLVNDPALAFGLQKYTHRYKDAERVQKKAEKKYGAENTVTVGHSLGGALASDVGKKSSHTVTYNKGFSVPNLFHKANRKETNIRAKGDAVSALSTLHKGEKIKTIKNGGSVFSKGGKAIAKAHDLSQLNKLGNQDV